MSVEERDPYTGHMTTGHDWNGIKELNTKVPLIVFFFLISTFIFSITYWILMPSWPSTNSFYKGVLGVDQREQLTLQLQSSKAKKFNWSKKFNALSFDDIRKEPALMKIVTRSGPALFKDNCAMCHGQTGQGGSSFPALNDTAWLWGGDADSIYKTLQVGINSDHPQSRVAQMPALKTLQPSEGDIADNIALYVRSLSNTHIGNGSIVKELLAVSQGKKSFTKLCAACHGMQATGNQALGAPNLSDNAWLYGGDQQSVSATIRGGRSGQMPAWDARFSAAELKLLTLYVLSLSSGSEQTSQSHASPVDASDSPVTVSRL